MKRQPLSSLHFILVAILCVHWSLLGSSSVKTSDKQKPHLSSQERQTYPKSGVKEPFYLGKAFQYVLWSLGAADEPDAHTTEKKRADRGKHNSSLQEDQRYAKSGVKEPVSFRADEPDVHPTDKQKADKVEWQENPADEPIVVVTDEKRAYEAAWQRNYEVLEALARKGVRMDSHSWHCALTDEDSKLLAILKSADGGNEEALEQLISAIILHDYNKVRQLVTNDNCNQQYEDKLFLEHALKWFSHCLRYHKEGINDASQLSNSREIVKLYISKGAEVTDAALGAAVSSGDPELVGVVVTEQSCNIRIDGKSMLQIAFETLRATNRGSVVRLLLEKGAEATDAVLGAAVRSGATELIDLVVTEQNCNVHVGEKSLLQIAIEKLRATQRRNVVCLLREKGSVVSPMTLKAAINSGDSDLVAALVSNENCNVVVPWDTGRVENGEAVIQEENLLQVAIKEFYSPTRINTVRVILEKGAEVSEAILRSAVLIPDLPLLECILSAQNSNQQKYSSFLLKEALRRGASGYRTELVGLLVRHNVEVTASTYGWALKTEDVELCDLLRPRLQVSPWSFDEIIAHPAQLSDQVLAQLAELLHEKGALLTPAAVWYAMHRSDKNNRFYQMVHRIASQAGQGWALEALEVCGVRCCKQEKGIAGSHTLSLLSKKCNCFARSLFMASKKQVFHECERFITTCFACVEQGNMPVEICLEILLQDTDIMRALCALACIERRTETELPLESILFKIIAQYPCCKSDDKLKGEMMNAVEQCYHSLVRSTKFEEFRMGILRSYFRNQGGEYLLQDMGNKYGMVLAGLR